MNKFISRIICICLSICLFFCFTFNVSAASDFYYINILDYCSMNDSGSNYINLNTNDFEFYYDFPFNERLYSVELLIKCSGSADRITEVVATDEDDNTYSVTEYTLTNGFYRLSFNCGGQVIESLTFNFTLNTTSTTYCSVMQFRASAFDSLAFKPKYDAVVETKEDDNYNTEQFTNVNIFSTEDLTSNDGFYVDINVDKWQQYDFISWYFSSNSANINSVACDVYLLNSSGGIASSYAIPINVQYLNSNSTNVESSYFTFIVDADLTSVPKDNDNFFLRLHITGAGSPDAEWVYPFSFNCISCTGYIRSDNLTNPLYYWLAVIESNTSGLSGSLGMINNAINSFKQAYTNGVNNIIVWLDTIVDAIGTYINNLIRSIQQQFANLGNFLTNLFNPPGSQDAPADLQDSLADQNDQLVSIDQELNAVEKVDPDDLNISLDSFVSQDHLNLATSGLSNILGNEIILQVLIMSITFAMVGYILFGKR